MNSLQRVAVMVVGMHRSGTSALSRVLNLIGCDLPKTLMVANAANEAGYWESSAVMRLNDRILASAASTWDDWLEFDPNWVHSPRAYEFRAATLATLNEEFGSSPLFVFKDPRTCRFPQFWIEAFKEFGARPVAILPVRNPLEVAASLEARDGFDRDFSALLWLRHMLDAEHGTRGIKRYFASYERLMTDCSFLVREAGPALDLHWPRLSLRVSAEIEAFLSNRHRRNHVANIQVTANLALSNWIRESFAILSKWTDSGEDSRDVEALDRIRQELNSASPAFSALVASGRKATAKAREQERRLAELQAKLDDTTTASDRLAQMDAQSAHLKAEIEAEREAVRAAHHEVAHLRSHLDQTEKALQQQCHETEEITAKLDQASAESARLRAEIEAEREAVRAARHELTDVRSQLDQTEKALQQQSNKSDQSIAEVQQVRDDLKRLAARYEQAERLIGGYEEHIRLLIEDVKEGEEAGIRQQGEVEALRRRLKEAEEVEGRQRKEIEDLQGSLHQRLEIHKQLDERYAAQDIALAQWQRTFQTLMEEAGIRQQGEVEALRRRLKEAEEVEGRQRKEIEDLQGSLHQRLEIHKQLDEKYAAQDIALAQWQRTFQMLMGDGRRPRLLNRIHNDRHSKLIRRSGLVDAEWYLTKYKDVADAGADPVRHYVQYGAAEGRAPNPVIAGVQLSLEGVDGGNAESNPDKTQASGLET